MPEPSAIDLLLASPPFDLDEERKSPLFLAAMREAFSHHLAASEPFRRISEAQGLGAANDLTDVTRAPYVPASLFKRFDLLSVPREEVRAVLHSSSTSGQPSRVAVDDLTARRQSVASARTIAAFLGHERRPFLVVDENPTAAPPGTRVTEIPARQAASRGFTAFATTVEHLIRRVPGGPAIDLDHLAARVGACEVLGVPSCLFGLTSVLYHDVVRPLLERGRVFLLPAGSSVAHIGGWKRLMEAQVDRARFLADVCSVFGIALENVFDFYGFTEQMGLVYGSAGLEPKVVPAYSEVVIRDPRTLAPAPDGEPGLLQVLTPLPHSHPGISVLTEDIARVISRGSSDRGRHGTRFEVLGRAEHTELRGCGDLPEQVAR